MLMCMCHLCHLCHQCHLHSDWRQNSQNSLQPDIRLDIKLIEQKKKNNLNVKNGHYPSSYLCQLCQPDFQADFQGDFGGGGGGVCDIYLNHQQKI